MTVGERLKHLRKQKLGLTLEKFSARLHVGKSAISDIESGRNNLTNQMASSISKEFSVSEKWLRTGEGDMFIQKRREEQIAEYFHDLQGLNDELKKRLVAALAAIQTKDWEIIRQIVEKIVRDNEMKDAVESQQDGEDADQRQNIHLVQAAHQRTDIDIPEDTDTSDDEFFD